MWEDRLIVEQPEPTSHFSDLDGLRVHHLEAGERDAPAVIMLHGWPTSSHLWRNILGEVAAAGNRAIAPDLPGFGRSDKPDASYSFRFHDQTLDRFCEANGIEETGLVVHDLGGPVGLHWISQRPERLTRLALLNTLVFAKPSPAVIAFVLAARTPGVRSLLASERGLRFTMKIGMEDDSRRDRELIEAVLEPFRTDEGRRALIKSATSLHPSGFKEIERWLPTVEVPVKMLYGANDRILPDVAKTMEKVAEILPGAEKTAIEGCRHFLQEDRPERVAEELAAFFSQRR